MKQYSLVLCLLLFPSGSSVADTIKNTQSILEGFKEYDHNVASACDSIAEILKTIEGLHVIQADGIVRDHKTGTETIGCLAYVTGNIHRNNRSEFPHETLREKLEANTWREDISRAGDGPSSTTYSLGRDEAMCTISAIWGFASKEEKNTLPEDEYELQAQCMKRPANKEL